MPEKDFRRTPFLANIVWTCLSKILLEDLRVTGVIWERDKTALLIQSLITAQILIVRDRFVPIS